jgi:hypothetical protein
LLVAIVAAGCGSDGEQALSRDELVQRANDICSEHLGNIERLEKEFGPTGDDDRRSALEVAAEVFPRIADEFRSVSDKLGELTPPDDLAEQYGLTLDRIDRTADQLDRAAEAAENRDRQEYNAVLRQSTAADSIQRFFQANGFSECV